MSKFFSRFMPHAKRASAATGIDPRIILAQAALESGFGKKAPGNNFFGIKSHGKGGGQTFTTHEVINGKRVKIKDSFRQYSDPGQSFDGYANFMNTNKRYRNMKGAKGLDAQIAALQRSGYATDPNYGSKIRSIASGINMGDAPAMALAPQAAAPNPAMAAISKAIQPSQGNPMQETPAYNPMDMKPYQDKQRAAGMFGIPKDKWLALAAGFGGSDSFGEGASRASRLLMDVDQRYNDKNDAARKEYEQQQQLAQVAGGLNLTPQEKQLLQVLPPPQQMQYLQKKMMEKPAQRRIIKGADGYNYYEGGDRVLPNAQAPEPDQPTMVREYEYAKAQGFPGSLTDYAQAKKGKGFVMTMADGTTVQMGGAAGQSKGVQPFFDKQTGKNEANLLKEAQDSASAAQEIKATIEQMRQVSPQVGYTGPMGDMYGKLDDMIKILPGDEGARGAFKNMSMEAQLSMTEKTKGAITDREMGMFKAAVPGLGQTPEGNEQIMKVMEAAADRAVQRVTEMEKYRQANGTLAGFAEQWKAYIESNPLILQTENGIQLATEADPAQDAMQQRLDNVAAPGTKRLRYNPATGALE